MRSARRPVYRAAPHASNAKESGEEKNILFLLCGHGYFDMTAYESYLSGEMTDYSLPREEIEEALRAVPVV